MNSEVGPFKNAWPLAPLRVSGLDRVRLHAVLTSRAKLARSLAPTGGPFHLPLS